MKTNLKMFASVCAYACLALTVSSCDKDKFFEPKEDSGTTTVTEGYDFDFSTTRTVDLIVDYTDFGTTGPVRFAIYDTNPVINENTEDAYVSPNIKPLLEVYTDENGFFDQTITLPAYVNVLHVVTGYISIGFSHKLVEVVNNEAKVVVKDDGSTLLAARNARRAPEPGEPTNVLGKLRSTAFEVDGNGNTTSVQVYKEWGTPLGTWYSVTGRPDYRMNEQDYNQAVQRGLALSEEEVADMWNTACNILPNNSGIDNSQYRTSADVMIKDDSEVTITALGSFTCWNTTLGYYFYNSSSTPTTYMDLNPIMLFPNTQDGMRYGTSGNYQNNIGMVRGDVIQLMYYPNIASNDPAVKYSNPTTLFPKGTKIGFIIRTNGWGMMGPLYATKNGSTTYKNAMNIWVASTEGMSYAKPFSGNFKKPNPTGEARTAMFSYTSDANKKYCILAFEDACDDTDYNDLIFALNPASALLGLNDVEKGKTTTSGVYAFEDMWPERGDYDMNDIIVDCKHQIEYNDKGKVSKEIYNLTTYQNLVGLVSGLAMKLNTKVTPKSIVMKKGHKDGNAAACTFTKDAENCYYLTSDVKAEINTTYTFEITYSTAQELKNISTIEPFLYGDREGKYWEVHLPGKKPTSKMDMSFFHTYDDVSDINAGRYYVRNSLFPFAFYLEGASAEDFMNTILASENESTPINVFYPDFIQWSTSKGEKCKDWYLRPTGTK